MRALLQYKTYSLAFYFSKYILTSSTLIGFSLLVAKVPVGFILLLKILFFGIIYVIQYEQRLNQRFTFYKNLGISKTILFFIAFSYDILMLLIANLILRIF